MGPAWDPGARPAPLPVPDPGGRLGPPEPGVPGRCEAAAGGWLPAAGLPIPDPGGKDPATGCPPERRRRLATGSLGGSASARAARASSARSRKPSRAPAAGSSASTQATWYCAPPGLRARLAVVAGALPRRSSPTLKAALHRRQCATCVLAGCWVTFQVCVRAPTARPDSGSIGAAPSASGIAKSPPGSVSSSTSMAPPRHSTP